MQAFILIFKGPNIEDEEEYIAFIERTIQVKITDCERQPDLFRLIKIYQIIKHVRNVKNARLYVLKKKLNINCYKKYITSLTQVNKTLSHY